MLLEHGAEKDRIYQLFQIKKPETIYDFSTNTSIFSHDRITSLISDVKSDIENGTLLAEYPDTDCDACRRYYADKLEVSANNILMLNGSNQGIYLIASYYVGKRVAIMEPTYPEYEKALLAYGAKVIHVWDLDELKKLIQSKEIEGVFLCNPNNPTGELIDHMLMHSLVSMANAYGVEIVIDEAYVDFLYEMITSETSLVQCIGDGVFSHLILLRSMTKVYQLAGVRIGYLVGNPERVAELKSRQPSWSVNSIAQKLVLAYEGHDNQNMKTYYKKESSRVIEQLRSYGYIVRDTVCNFFLIEIKDDLHLIKYLLRKGIVVRHTRNHPGLDGNFIRVAILDASSNDYLLKHMKMYDKKTYY